MIKKETSYDFEKKWGAYWAKHKFFHSNPNEEKNPYVVTMPPPNVTGILHMGHVLNQVIQDILVRKARMEGKESCWVPGTDHASIATEAKVVALLKGKGTSKAKVGREKFLKEAWVWKEKYGNIITNQLKKLGISCDWNRYRFTMEPDLSKAVIKSFVTLYKKGYIYQDKRIIHWDPKGKTALANEEVIYREVDSYLYYIRYKQVDGPNVVTVATTRPETILGDTALCVHPDDKRYQHLHGKSFYTPLSNRKIPMITDGYVDASFGTGCLKITPAHDLNDYEIAQRHNLPIINILTEEGRLNEKAGFYTNDECLEARSKIVKDLSVIGQLEKKVPYKHKVGFSERTNAIIQPKISTQWFVKMKRLAAPAIKALKDGTIQFHPNKFVNLYMAWMENIKDWCISRQLWWGQRIPVYYLPNGRYVVAHNIGEALVIARKKRGSSKLRAEDLKQDPDVLDTWFSSWLWPISVFKGTLEPNNEDFRYYYPTHDLVTAPEIIFFWVARMIMAGYAFTGRAPFKNVYFTGIVRDKQKRKMSKSLGNSPDPLTFIKQYGADGVRAGMLFCAPAGNDLLFDEKLLRQGSQFVHKIKNAFRLVKSWQPTEEPTVFSDQVAINWFNARLQQTIKTIREYLNTFQLSKAFILTYRLIWDDFCSHYLEMIKRRGKRTMPKMTYQATLDHFEELMKLLHPYMPFITEEIWQSLRTRKEGESIVVAPFPTAKPYDDTLLTKATHTFALIAKVRQLKTKVKLTSQTPLTLHFRGKEPSWMTHFASYIKLATNIINFQSNVTKPTGTTAFIINETTCWIPQYDTKESDKEAQQATLAKLEHYLHTLQAKLENAQFLAKAPKAVIQQQRDKEAVAKRRIEGLKEILKEC